MDIELLSNPLVTEYFNDWHLGNESPIGFAGMVVDTYFPRQYIYHSGQQHIWPMLEMAMMSPLENDADVENQFVAFFFTLFHDAAVDIGQSRQILNKHININAGPKWRRLFEMVHEAIQASAYEFENIELLEPHVQFCIKLDIHGHFSQERTEIERQERLVFKEYQRVEFGTFVEERIKVLEHIYNVCRINPVGLEMRKSFLRNWQPRIAVFAGSFKPFHSGHMNVLKQAENDFDKVIIACGSNNDKGANAQYANIKLLKQHQVESYNTLLTNYLKSKPYNVTLIRGLRNGQDMQYEQNMRAALKDTMPHLRIVYYLCDPEVAHVSSSLCRDVVKYDQAQYMKYTSLGNYQMEY